MPTRSLPANVDTVIIGNGPSALILSFLLHGNTPYYNPTNPHPDPILHKKLSDSPCLLDLDVHDLTAHFAASRLSYSTQALPINVLLDTLVRPLADIDPQEFRTCLQWRLEVERKVPHVVLGNTAQVGGQWANNPVSASWDIGALSYAEMLSLPGYSFEDHYKNTNACCSLPNFHRPTRREVAEYLAAYYKEVGIEDSVYTDVDVGDIRRIDSGFHLGSHNITCKHLVLASGIFSSLIPPRPPLRPLYALPRPNASSDAPLLVVGSGFTAADIIVSTPAHRKIIHIFKWDPENRPSPLRACHPRAYPEYASVYRRMKLAANQTSGPATASSPVKGREYNSHFMERDWDNDYEGFPNTYIKDVEVHGDTALLGLETRGGSSLRREISKMEYVIGRRGSLSYLDNRLAGEVLSTSDQTLDHKNAISGQTLRSRVETNLEVSPNVYAIGSLTGDSLVRFAYGGCVFTAREIIKRTELAAADSGSGLSSRSKVSPTPSNPQSNQMESGNYDFVSANGDTDLCLKRPMHSISTDREISLCEPWRESGWWAGGCTLS